MKAGVLLRSTGVVTVAAAPRSPSRRASRSLRPAGARATGAQQAVVQPCMACADPDRQQDSARRLGWGRS